MPHLTLNHRVPCMFCSLFFPLILFTQLFNCTCLPYVLNSKTLQVKVCLIFLCISHSTHCPWNKYQVSECQVRAEKYLRNQKLRREIKSKKRQGGQHISTNPLYYIHALNPQVMLMKADWYIWQIRVVHPKGSIIHETWTNLPKPLSCYQSKGHQFRGRTLSWKSRQGYILALPSRCHFISSSPSCLPYEMPLFYIYPGRSFPNQNAVIFFFSVPFYQYMNRNNIQRRLTGLSN